MKKRSKELMELFDKKKRENLNRSEDDLEDDILQESIIKNKDSNSKYFEKKLYEFEEYKFMILNFSSGKKNNSNSSGSSYKKSSLNIYSTKRKTNCVNSNLIKFMKSSNKTISNDFSQINNPSDQKYNLDCENSNKNHDQIIKTPEKLKEDSSKNLFNKKLSQNCSTNFTFINTDQNKVNLLLIKTSSNLKKENLCYVCQINNEINIEEDDLLKKFQINDNYKCLCGKNVSNMKVNEDKSEIKCRPLDCTPNQLNFFNTNSYSKENKYKSRYKDSDIKKAE